MTIVIIDCGTFETKYGIKDPFVFRTVVGRQRNVLENNTVQKKPLEPECYVGDDALNKSDELSLTYPIEKGVIVNWEDMEIIWKYIFKKLSVDPEECNVVLTAPFYPRNNRVKIAKVMFEVLRVKGLYVTTQESLFFSQCNLKADTNGIVLSSGEGATFVMPFKNGRINSQFGIKFDMAGADITHHLAYMLAVKNKSLTLDEVRQFKEKYCTLASKSENSENETVKYLTNIEYRISKSCTLIAGVEATLCFEAMFAPNIFEVQCFGLQNIIFNFIKSKYLPQSSKPLYFLLYGGNTLCQGFGERLIDSIKQLYKDINEKNIPTMSVVNGPETWNNVTFISSKFSKREDYEDNKFNISEWPF